MDIRDNISSSHFVTPEVTSQTAAWSAPVLLREGRINALYQVSHHGQRFLLKALRPEYRNSALYRQMLQHEFELGVTLDHPHVVRTLDKGYMPEIGDYIQLEWVEGQTLGEWLSDGPSRAQRRRVLEQLVDAVGYLHRHQIVHRDLKPANIMVTTNGSNVRLIDFGLSDKDSYECRW